MAASKGTRGFLEGRDLGSLQAMEVMSWILLIAWPPSVSLMLTQLPQLPFRERKGRLGICTKVRIFGISPFYHHSQGCRLWEDLGHS